MKLKKISVMPSGNFDVTPLCDFHIFLPPLHDIYLIKGEVQSVPLLFKQNLLTEHVIKE